MKTRCECGRPMERQANRHGAKSGCERCNAIDGRNGYLRERTGERKPDKPLYGVRVAVTQASRRFWASRFLPEPPVDFTTPIP